VELLSELVVQLASSFRCQYSWQKGCMPVLSRASGMLQAEILSIVEMVIPILIRIYGQA
jgi:hypothetical protein